jgi:4-amino-4-deoxy-L-arabinose transferase-like glycosyltransferase
VSSPRVAAIAVGLAIVYHGFVGYTGLLLSETLATLLLTVLVVGILAIENGPRWIHCAGLGVLIGVSALCRAEFLLLPIFLFAVLWLLHRKTRLKPTHWIATYAIVLVTLAPWAIRNYRVTGEFILLTIHDGDNLWISTYEGEWLEFHPEQEPFRSLVAGLSDLESSKALRRAGLQNIVRSPLTYLKLCIRRVPRLWIGGHSNVFAGMEDSQSAYFARGNYGVLLVKLLMLAGNTLLVALGLIGGFFAYRGPSAERSGWLIVGVPIVYVTLIHFVFFSTPRYHIPVMPLVIVFTAVALASFRPPQWHRPLDRPAGN